ncbi:phosphatase PAP2 family protein [Anaerotignum sp.]
MEWILEMDGQFLLWLRGIFAHPLMDQIMIFISALGDGGFLWIALGVLFLLMGWKHKIWRKRGLLLLFSLAANALVCNLLLKPLVNRIRPYDLLGYDILIPPVGDASFPSGHTSASFAAATALYAIDKRWGTAAYVFAALMGFSRLYLGVHFPTDVLAGAAIGVFMAKAVQRVFRIDGTQSI